MNYILNVGFQFILLFTKKKFTYKSQIIFAFVVSIISMCCLPIFVILLQGNISFIISCILILIQGLANAIALSSLFSVISFLPFEYIIAFSTGNGIAGVMINVIRYIILFSVGNPDDEKNIVIGSLIFFGISAAIVLLGLIYFN